MRLVLSVFLFFSLAAEAPAEAADLRVLILEDTPKAQFSIYGNYQVWDVSNNQLIKEARHIFMGVIEPKGGSSEASSGGTPFDGLGLNCAGELIRTNHLRILPAPGSRFYLGFRRYHGALDFIVNKNSRLDVINIVDLEDYLKGVLFHEVSHRWPIEVLKAQAITSRSYALYKQAESAGNYYDLTSDTSAQMYGGAISERLRTSQAVESTTGMVLTYKGEILPAYYHACCGGHTEDSSQLWQIDLSPLKGAKCRYCRNTKHWMWKNKIKLDDISRALKKGGYKIWTIKAIDPIRHNRSGRVTKIDISSPWTSARLTGKEFRSLVGPNVIRSNNFTVQISGKYAVFRGYGWGHGVGFCQWGGYRMAKEGKTAKEILEFYYPETEIVNSEW